MFIFCYAIHKLYEYMSKYEKLDQFKADAQEVYDCLNWILNPRIVIKTM